MAIEEQHVNLVNLVVMEILYLNSISINILISILCYRFVRCYYSGKLGTVYTRTSVLFLTTACEFVFFYYLKIEKFN